MVVTAAASVAVAILYKTVPHLFVPPLRFAPASYVQPAEVGFDKAPVPCWAIFTSITSPVAIPAGFGITNEVPVVFATVAVPRWAICANVVFTKKRIIVKNENAFFVR